LSPRDTKTSYKDNKIAITVKSICKAYALFVFPGAYSAVTQAIKAETQENSGFCGFGTVIAIILWQALSA
jgi:hypothetical protein